MWNEPGDAEEADERVPLADQEPAARQRFARRAHRGDAPAREPHRDREVHERQPAQPAVDLLGHRLRLQQHQVLDRAERADTAAEHAPEEERRHKRQEEEGEDAVRDQVAGIDQRQRDVLDRADRAGAALAVEAEVGDRGDAERDGAGSAAATSTRYALRPRPAASIATSIPRAIPDRGSGCVGTGNE